jgi:hypothetical protein
MADDPWSWNLRFEDLSGPPTGWGLPGRFEVVAAQAERDAARAELATALARVAAIAARPALFQLGEFTLAGGAASDWKIECDSLTAVDWAALARIASRLLPPFGDVEGVPTGGLPFADALRQYACHRGPLLIADDVCSTGGSMEKHRAGREAIGVCAFARGTPPAWVTPLFTLAASRDALLARVAALEAPRPECRPTHAPTGEIIHCDGRGG